MLPPRRDRRKDNASLPQRTAHTAHFLYRTMKNNSPLYIASALYAQCAVVSDRLGGVRVRFGAKSKLTTSSRHVEPGRSTAKAFGAKMRASSHNAGAVGCREHRDQVMQGGEPPLSDIGSNEDGQGSASAPRRNAMASLAAISPCAGLASANAMAAGC
jgi:hypothetical protein